MLPRLDQNRGESITQLKMHLISYVACFRTRSPGKVPSNKIGRHWRFQKRASERWLERTEEANHRSEGGW